MSSNNSLSRSHRPRSGRRTAVGFSNAPATAAFILAIVAAVPAAVSSFGWTISAPLAALALALGIIGRYRARHRDKSGETAAVVAIILASASLFLVIVAATTPLLVHLRL